MPRQKKIGLKGTMTTSLKESKYEKVLEEFDRSVCILCQQCHEDEEVYGKLLKKAGITVHYFCMLFSSGLSQNGESEKEGVFGFLAKDILKEVKRGSRLKCIYCKKKGATIGCVVKSCRKVFHFGCGRKSSTLHQFFDTYRSYCPDHRPRQQCNVSDRLAFFGTALSTCAICMNAVEARASNETLRAPCCKNAWYHRICVQKHASTAGLYFFKCPLCNNKEIFQAEMLTYGIYLPDQDAAWEQEPNAFGDLLERYKHCDAKKCKCLEGRDWNNDGSKWEIILCDWCGSQGSHVECKFLLKIGKYDICPSCKEIDEKEKAQKKESKTPMKKRTSMTTRKSVASSEEGSKVKSSYPGPCRQLCKTGLPTPERFDVISHFSSSSPSSSPQLGGNKNFSSGLLFMSSPRPTLSRFQKTEISLNKSPSSHSTRSVPSPHFGRRVQKSPDSGRMSRNTSPSTSLTNLSYLGSSLSYSGRKSNQSANSPTVSKVMSIPSLHSDRISTSECPSTSSIFSRLPTSLQFDSRGRSKSKYKTKFGKSSKSMQKGSLFGVKVNKETPKRALTFQTDDAGKIEPLPRSPFDQYFNSLEKPKTPVGSRTSMGSKNKTPRKKAKSEIVQVTSDSLRTNFGSNKKFKSKSQEPLSSKPRKLKLSLKRKTANQEKTNINCISPIIPNQNTMKKFSSLERSLQKSNSEKYRLQSQLKRKSTNTLKPSLLSPHQRSKKHVLSNVSLKSSGRPTKMSPRKIIHSNPGLLQIKLSAQDVDVIGVKENEQEFHVHQIRDSNSEKFEDLNFRKHSTGKIAKRMQRKSRTDTNIQYLSAPASSVIAQDQISICKWKNRNVRSSLLVNDGNASKLVNLAARNSSVICTPDGSFAEYRSSLDDSLGSFAASDSIVSSADAQDTFDSEFNIVSLPLKRVKKDHSRRTINDSMQESEINRSADLQAPFHRSKRMHSKWTCKKPYKYIKNDISDTEMGDVDLGDAPFSSFTDVDKDAIFQENPQETESTNENGDKTCQASQDNLVKGTKELKKNRCSKKETSSLSSNIVEQFVHPFRTNIGRVAKSEGKSGKSKLLKEQNFYVNKLSETETSSDKLFLKAVVEGTRHASIAFQKGIKRKKKRSLEEMGQFTLNRWLKEGKVGLPNCRQKYDCQKQEKEINVQDQHIQSPNDLVLKWRGNTFILKNNSLVETNEALDTWKKTKKIHPKNIVNNENFSKSRTSNVNKSITDVLSSSNYIGNQESIQISEVTHDTDNVGIVKSKDGMSNLRILADLSHDFRVTRQMVNSEFRMVDSKQPHFHSIIDGQKDDMVDGGIRTETEFFEKTAARSVGVAQAKKEHLFKRYMLSDDTQTIQNTEKETKREDEDMEDTTRKLSNSEKHKPISEENHFGDNVSAALVPENEQVLLTMELNKNVDYFDFSSKENHVINEEKPSMIHISGGYDIHQDNNMKDNNSKEDKNSLSDKGKMLEYYSLNEEKLVSLLCTTHESVSS